MKASALREMLDNYIEAYGDIDVTFKTRDTEVEIDVGIFTQYTENFPHSHIMLAQEK